MKMVLELGYSWYESYDLSAFWSQKNQTENEREMVKILK